MNRETKFGLITGLLLIVAIGMLISRYLSSRAAPAIQTPSLQSLGGSFRRQMISPAGTAVIPSALGSGRKSQSPGTPSSALAEQLPTTPPQPDGSIFAATQPSAIASPLGQASASLSPVRSPVSLMTNVSQPIPRRDQKTSTQYTVKSGDTLWHIARQFYHQAGPAQLARIVRANPGKLSSAKSMLRIGETLVIPAGSSSGQVHLTQMAAISMGSVPVPSLSENSSGLSNLSSPPAGHRGSAHISAVTYKVRAGDTLYSIARRIFGVASATTIKQMMRENHIHNAHDLRVGMILRVGKPR